MRRHVKWWQVVIAIVVTVLVVFGASWWFSKKRQVATEYQPEGTAERIEQMQQMPAAGGAPMPTEAGREEEAPR